MFGTSGIRGPVGETVTASLALRVGHAVGAETDRVVVGRDPRTSGPFLVDALSAGLREVGTDVLDVGVAATPTIARGVGWAAADAGVAVTASHNPPPDNGLKLWRPSGRAFDADDRARITDRLEAEDPSLEPWDRLGHRYATASDDRHDGGGGSGSPSFDPAGRHVEALRRAAGTDALERHVVVDVGNGTGGVTVEALQALGCHVETLNARPDGRFPGRPSEPTRENCGALRTLVAEGPADLGIAHDGDADRMRAVAADGTFPGGDALLSLFAGAAAEAGERVAVPVDTSLAVADYLRERDVEVVRTPVGDVHVAAAASEPGVAFGGEPSGAWIWPDETLCPDGPLAAVRLVAMDAAEPLAARLEAVPSYPIRRESVPVEAKVATMTAVESAVRERYDAVETLDGVRVTVEDGWFLIRASGTQPIVRVTAETRDADRSDALLATARSIVERAVEAGSVEG